jgi:hypothetical protein
VRGEAILLPIPTLRRLDFPMTSLARFICRNTRTPIPARPLAKRPAILRPCGGMRSATRGTSSGTLRHVSRRESANLRFQEHQVRHNVQYNRYVMPLPPDRYRNIFPKWKITRVQVTLQRREVPCQNAFWHIPSAALCLKPIEKTGLFAKVGIVFKKTYHVTKIFMVMSLI